jgi:succinoglycan biosynthesis transport protein ExoP
MNEPGEVKLHFLDYWRVIRVRWGIVLLTFLLVMVTAGITTYFLPRQYLSTVTLEVKPDSYKGADAFGDTQRGSTDIRFAPTQFQIIQQKELLYPVIDDLKLTEKWSAGGSRIAREQAYFKLKGMMRMTEVRNTDLIKIGIYSTDAEEAANIANAIAVVYQEKRRSDQDTLVKQGLGQVSEEVAKQRKVVQEAAAEAAQLRIQQGIVDINPETIDAAQTNATQSVVGDEQKADDVRIEVAKLSTQIEQISRLKPEELMVGLHTLGIEDPTVMKVLPVFQEAVAEEARLLSSGLGQRHPRVASLRATKDVYTQQLNEAITALRGSLATKLKIQEATLRELEKKVAESKGLYQKERLQSKEYIEAKTKYVMAKKVLDAAEMNLSTQAISNRISFQPAKIWEKAEPARSPAKPNVPIYMALAALVGLIMGVGLAFFLEYLDTSVKTLEDVEKFLGIPVLAVIPRGIQLLYRERGDSADAECYRILRTSIEFNRKNPDANTITLISGGPGEGKSTTLFNLACTCARGGYNVLVVDADLRRPSQHRNFEMDNSTGLANYLQSNVPYEEVIRSTEVENLSFIPSGILPSDAVGILNSQRMSDLISRVKHQYDLVFFDSPPILGVSDGAVLSSEVDITIMVVQHRRFPRAMLQRVKQAVLSVGGNLLGVVLNNVDVRHDQGYQYYTNYYNYYAPQRETEQVKKRPREISRVPAAKSGQDFHGSDEY